MHTFEHRYDDLFSTVAAEYLQSHIRRQEVPSDYVAAVGQEHATDPLYDVLYHKVAHLMDPVDPVLGVEAKKRYSNAFLRASSVAIDVTSNYLTRDFCGAMVGRAIFDFSCAPDAMPKDPIELAAMQAERGGLVTDAAERGWAQIPACHRVLEDLFAASEQDVLQQISMQRGFGFVIYLAVATRESRNADDIASIDERLAAKANDDLPDSQRFDLTSWDEAARELAIEISAEDNRNDPAEE